MDNNSFDPNHIDRERVGCFALINIGGDEGNGRAGVGLEREGRSKMQSIECPQLEFLCPHGLPARLTNNRH